MLVAVETNGRGLLSTVPKDIADWCPAYAENGPDDRAAFWAGFVSTLARYESTWNPRAVGGNGRVRVAGSTTAEVGRATVCVRWS